MMIEAYVVIQQESAEKALDVEELSTLKTLIKKIRDHEGLKRVYEIRELE